MTEKLSQNELLSLTTEIVASHLSNNTVAVSDIPQLIKLVFSTLATQGVEEEKEQPEKLMPAVPIKKSVMPEYIICLEDGKKLKMLKRHLKTRYNMTPEDYRKRWGLRTTIRWWRRTTPSSARASPRRSASAPSRVPAAAAASPDGRPMPRL